MHYDPRRPKLRPTISDADRALVRTVVMGGLTLLMIGVFVLGVLMLLHVVPFPQHDQGGFQEFGAGKPGQLQGLPHSESFLPVVTSLPCLLGR